MAWEKQAYSCAEMVGPEICASKKLMNILEDPNVHLLNKHEALLCMLHVFMEEENFIPCTTQDLWHKAHFYSISYTHPTTGDIVCQLKYLPLNDAALVFGLAGTKEVAKEHLKYNLYVKDYTGRNPYEMYKSIPELSRSFKDNVVKNIVVGVQEYANINPTFGLPVLALEMKLEILNRMDATAIVGLSRANKEFRDLIEQPSTATWKRLLFHDFPKYKDQSDGDWKALYKTEYAAKKVAEKREKEQRKKEREEQERQYKFRRSRGMDDFSYEFLSMPRFFGEMSDPRRRFGFPPEPARRRDFASVNLHWK